MALDDAIEAAMDRAEARLSSPEQETVESAPEASDVVEDVAVSEAVKEASETRSRDDSGKFTKGAQAKSPKSTSKTAPKAPKVEAQTETAEKQISDQVADTQEEAAQEAEAPLEPSDVPMFWSAELKALAAEAPKDLVKAFAKHDAQREEWARRMATESERGKAYEKRANEVFEPHRLKLQANGIKDPFDAAERLLAWNDIFETDPKAGIADLMRKNNLTPQDFIGDLGQEQPRGTDPRVDDAIREAKEAREEFTAYRQSQEQAAHAAELNAFREGTDSSGQKRGAFVDAYAPQIADAIREIRQQHPQLQRGEILNHAYEFVLSEVRKLHGVKPQAVVSAARPQQAVAAPKPSAVKAKAAASSVVGAPGAGSSVQRPRLKGESFNERLEAAMDNAEESLGFR